MDMIEKLVQRVRKIQQGFLDIQKAADEVIAEQTPKECLRIAKLLYASVIYQDRSLATFILGRLAANSTESLEFLKRHVSQDSDWRVLQRGRDILAWAFVGPWARPGAGELVIWSSRA